MTDPNKAAVLAKYKRAASFQRPYGWIVEHSTLLDGWVLVGQGNTEAEAWADAARRLK